MELGDLTNALHVVNGEAASLAVIDALRLNSKQVLINDDPLSFGPAPNCEDLEEWRAIREQFVKDVYAEQQDHTFGGFAKNDLSVSPERLEEGNPIIIWVALGLPEQLLLARIVNLFDRLKLDYSNLWVVQFETLRPRQRVLGIGELRPKDIHQYCPEPHQLSTDEVNALRLAWRVYTSSAPENLNQFCTQHTPSLILHNAISQLVFRYPDLRSGVSIWDEKLLRYTSKDEPNAAYVVANTFGTFDSLDIGWDAFLYKRLIAMGKDDLKSRLVSASGNLHDMRKCQVKITPIGEEVLAGNINHALENGIDDWIGGVHLCSAEGKIMFRDGDTILTSHE